MNVPTPRVSGTFTTTLYNRLMIARLKWANVGIIRAKPCGFFGNLRITLNGIRLCEVAGAEPFPLWLPGDSLYHDPKRGGNAWEYFFEPTYTLPPETDATYRSNALCFAATAADVYPSEPGDSSRQLYGRLIDQYVRLKPELADGLAAYEQDLGFDDKTLGVHMRLTDVVTEGRQGGGIDEYLARVDEVLAGGDYSNIFLACDDEKAVDATTARYGCDRVMRTDSIRSATGKSIHGHYDEGVDASGFRKGSDVIYDAMLLSRCRSVVCIKSAVTFHAWCVNQAQTHYLLDGTTR